MDKRPIGVFDSGLGGLTAVRVLRELLPNENIIYFGDTGRMPYGVRPASQIREIAAQNIDFMLERGVKAIIAACGTISSNADDILSECRTKAVGVLKPGVRELAATGVKRLGIIATETSIKSGSFQRELLAAVPDAEVSVVACPRFVPMIESGHFGRNDKVVRTVVAETLEPLKKAGVEALLLGCTHYGIIADAIRDYLEGAATIGAADASAKEMSLYLEANGLLGGDGGEQYYTSGDKEDFEALAPIMLGREIKTAVHFVKPFPLKG